ncbi:MAG: EamA family transporter [Planctomycetaceae bacterium]|nr:EamA family transporter [Planctomycetaceae bacterium]
MTMASANFLGVLSLLFWSMNVALTRVIGEAHPLGMPGLSFLAAGIMLIGLDTVKKKPMPWKSDAGPMFWLVGGGAFVIYLVLYALGLSYSDSREVVLPLGLLNYCWPSLMLVMMPFFFAVRVRWPILGAGMVLCVIGVGCSLLWGMSLRQVAAVAASSWPPFLMMAGAALLWAFYSNVARKWGNTASGTGWFMLVAGLFFLGMWLVAGGPLGLTRAMLVPLILHALIVNAAAFLFWDCGVRWGDMGLMGVLANFLPVGSVLFGLWYFGNASTTSLWLGGIFVTLGAILCRKGIHLPGTE